MPTPPNRLVLILVILLAPVLGWAKVEYQRTHPPSWASKPIHQLEGYVSIDGFGRRAAQVRDVLRGDDPEARALLESLRGELHPSSLTVPVAAGALSIVTGSVPIAFMLVNLALYGLSIWMVVRIARLQLAELGLEDAGSCAVWAGLVFAAHVDTCRTAIQLHLDFAVTCIGLAAVVTTWNGMGQRCSATRSAGVVGLHLLGAFTKFSYAPFLAVAAVAARLSGSSAKRFGMAALTLIVPLASLAAYALALGHGGSMVRDAVHFREAWKLSAGQVGHFAVEIALALQWLPLVFVVPRRSDSKISRFVSVIVAIYLLSLLCFGLPAVPRLYMPVVALLSAVCVPLLLAVKTRLGAWPIYAWATLNFLLATLGIRYGS